MSKGRIRHSAIADVVREVWTTQQYPEGVDSIDILGGGEQGWCVVALPTDRWHGRYGYCYVDHGEGLAAWDAAVEKAIACCWFDSPYRA